MEQHHRFWRVPDRLEVSHYLLVGDARALGQAPARVLLIRSLPEPCNELLLLPLEVLLFLNPPPISQEFLLCHLLPSSLLSTAIRGHTRPTDVDKQVRHIQPALAPAGVSLLGQALGGVCASSRSGSRMDLATRP